MIGCHWWKKGKCEQAHLRHPEKLIRVGGCVLGLMNNLNVDDDSALVSTLATLLIHTVVFSMVYFGKEGRAVFISTDIYAEFILTSQATKDKS